MPRYIVLEILPHVSDEEAQEFAQEINEYFQPHHEAYVAWCDTKLERIAK